MTFEHEADDDEAARTDAVGGEACIHQQGRCKSPNLIVLIDLIGIECAPFVKNSEVGAQEYLIVKLSITLYDGHE